MYIYEKITCDNVRTTSQFVNLKSYGYKHAFKICNSYGFSSAAVVR